jgi:hypothetical protein
MLAEGHRGKRAVRALPRSARPRAAPAPARGGAGRRGRRNAAVAASAGTSGLGAAGRGNRFSGSGQQPNVNLRPSMISLGGPCDRGNPWRRAAAGMGRAGGTAPSCRPDGPKDPGPEPASGLPSGGAGRMRLPGGVGRMRLRAISSAWPRRQRRPGRDFASGHGASRSCGPPRLAPIRDRTGHDRPFCPSSWSLRQSRLA